MKERFFKKIAQHKVNYHKTHKLAKGMLIAVTFRRLDVQFPFFNLGR
jgi:hypothetical protein